jgi:hypothetical protein
MDIEKVILELLAEPLDFNLAGIKDRLEKDLRAIDLFFRACAAHLAAQAIEIRQKTLAGDHVGANHVLTGAKQFRKYLKELKDAYLERSLSLAKFQFPKDIWNGKYRNPFAPEKQRVREFALHWELDPELIAILG